MILIIIIGALVLAGLRNASAQAGTQGTSPTTQRFLGVPIVGGVPRSGAIFAPENSGPPWAVFSDARGVLPGAPIIINPRRDDSDNQDGIAASAPAAPAATGGAAGGTSGGGGGASGSGGGGLGGMRFLR